MDDAELQRRLSEQKTPAYIDTMERMHQARKSAMEEPRKKREPMTPVTRLRDM